ncbi:hypothetical protein BGX26_007516 [Mortierella sp. AD094]|nr:hypothetical protein BGX26_007516 [Mortierella sp. AD094]
MDHKLNKHGDSTGREKLITVGDPTMDSGQDPHLTDSRPMRVAFVRPDERTEFCVAGHEEGGAAYQKQLPPEFIKANLENISLSRADNVEPINHLNQQLQLQHYIHSELGDSILTTSNLTNVNQESERSRMGVRAPKQSYVRDYELHALSYQPRLALSEDAVTGSEQHQQVAHRLMYVAHDQMVLHDGLSSILYTQPETEENGARQFLSCYPTGSCVHSAAPINRPTAMCNNPRGHATIDPQLIYGQSSVLSYKDVSSPLSNGNAEVHSSTNIDEPQAKSLNSSPMPTVSHGRVSLQPRHKTFKSSASKRRYQRLKNKRRGNSHGHHAIAVPAHRLYKIPRNHSIEDPADHHNHYRHQCDGEYHADHNQSHVHSPEGRALSSRVTGTSENDQGLVTQSSGHCNGSARNGYTRHEDIQPNDLYGRDASSDMSPDRHFPVHALQLVKS